MTKTQLADLAPDESTTTRFLRALSADVAPEAAAGGRG